MSAGDTTTADSTAPDGTAADMTAADMPRVCMLLETYHPEVGGGETQARLLAESLVERGFPVTVVTRRSKPSLPRREGVGGVPVRRIPPAGRGRLRKWGLLATAGPALLRLGGRCDVVLVCGFRILGLPAILTGRLLGVPCILKAESNGEMSGAFFYAGLARSGLSPSSHSIRTFLSLRNRALRRAAAFVALSSAIEEELRAGGVPPSRIHRIPNAVDLERFRPADAAEKREARASLELAADAPVVVYTGRLVRYKGLPVLLRAWAEVRRAHPRALLVLVGSEGADLHGCEAELRRTVAERALEESVRFTGAVEDVSPYLRAADAFAFPTEDEAFGISLLEAMASGLPAVTTPVGGVPDVVTDGKDALLVPPAQAEPLAAALSRLLQDRELAARLGAAARQTAQQGYGRRAVTDRYAALLENVAGTGEGERVAERAQAVRPRRAERTEARR